MTECSMHPVGTVASALGSLTGLSLKGAIPTRSSAGASPLCRPRGVAKMPQSTFAPPWRQLGRHKGLPHMHCFSNHLLLIMLYSKQASHWDLLVPFGMLDVDEPSKAKSELGLLYLVRSVCTQVTLNSVIRMISNV